MWLATQSELHTSGEEGSQDYCWYSHALPGSSKVPREDGRALTWLSLPSRHAATHLPAMLGFLVQAGWPLAGGGFSSCSSIMLDVWLCGGSGSPLQPDVMSLASAKLLRSATRRCNRTAHSTTAGEGFRGYKTFIKYLHDKHGGGHEVLIPPMLYPYTTAGVSENFLY